MNKTAWKPEPEIDFLLAPYEKIGIISCGTCANLSYTGGKTGIRHLKAWLKKHNKKAVFARVILACCPEEIMRQTLNQNRRALARCDALVVLACAGGIKAAFSCRPGIPVINVLDSVGSAVVACSDPVLARSLCRSCGNCVITHTAGICPLSSCPARTKYGPCKNYPGDGAPCVIDPSHECVWTEIIARGGDLNTLEKIKELHKAPHPRCETETEKPLSPKGKKFFGWHAARIQGLERVIRYFR